MLQTLSPDLTPMSAHRFRLAVSLATVLIAGFSIGVAWAQSETTDFQEPERSVEGNRLISERDPDISVRVPENARYLGARRILINERFDAEVHVFAEADDYGLIDRFYWLQFESFLPHVDGRYDYTSSNPETVTFDGLEMHVRPGGENTQNATIQPGTDYAAFRSLVDEAGLRLPNWLSTLRLVYLFEPTERSEFILFYGEGPDALAEAASEAMVAGKPGLMFADMLPDLIVDVDALVDVTVGEDQ